MTTPNVIPTSDLKLVRGRPKGLTGIPHTLCPGCGEAIAGRVITEVLDEMGVREHTVVAKGIGCYGQLLKFMDVDYQQALHGRAPALATGIKRALPDALVITFQGDGDLFAEGVNEVIQAAARGENITVICFNNGVSADTGGQMTPASVIGQKTKTTLGGRSEAVHGKPLKMAELLAAIDGTCFSARAAVNKPAEIQKAKRMLHRAFEAQLARRGFTYVEILTMCSTGWFMDPVEALDYIDTVFSKTHPVGVYKDVTEATPGAVVPDA